MIPGRLPPWDEVDALYNRACDETHQASKELSIADLWSMIATGARLLSSCRKQLDEEKAKCEALQQKLKYEATYSRDAIAERDIAIEMYNKLAARVEAANKLLKL